MGQEVEGNQHEGARQADELSFRIGPASLETPQVVPVGRS